ncbi:MAG: response regulator [Sphingomonadaceae bacterium]|nr:response regulator [Sphingomonadaceae bacterium]
MRILAIEDDALNRRVVRDMLAVAGVGMDEADGAEVGLRMIDEDRYDVILMDLRMPGIDGMEAIGHIRARPAPTNNLPVIVVTADAAEGLRDRCLDGGADELLLKPVAMEELFDAIGRVMAARGLSAGLMF